ncbi:MAG: TonB-dependent receptor [Bacteroidales bacterium]|nr:TonB-dependent receptor [Bacteroidales bacterium]
MAFAQVQTKVSGRVVDENGEPLPGVAVMVQGVSGGTVTDYDGNYSLSAPEGSTLSFSFIGFELKTIKVGAGANYNVTMIDESKEIDEVVVVGFGQQKKASVVGAIAQASGETLQRAAGINDIGAALTGNVPGVVTSQGTGQPGEEEPKIVIRGSSSWNNSDPLVLVDGIERPMNSVDMSSVENLSVLKDASATAVYGVRGANGVILITTKRGKEGKAHIDAGFTATLKRPSKLPNKYDSYDALMARNQTVENELPITPSESWAYITPQQTIEKYRNQTTQEQKERYPNVDWQDALFKDDAMSYNAYLNISGGTKFVKYFAAADYVNEGDLMKIYDNGRGYKSGYNYNRVNARSNLDFTITPTTVFKVNLAGSLAVKKAPRANAGDAWQEAQRWSGAYNIAPDVFLPQYSDGSWGMYPMISNVTNSAENLAVSGVAKTTTNTITTDFTLEQDLKFITEGLNLRGVISWDNKFVEGQRGIADDYNDSQRKWIDPETGMVTLKKDFDTATGFDWVETTEWSSQSGGVDNTQTYRRLYYQGQLNYARKFDEHDVSGTGVFTREENATGNEELHYRENWVFRVTYGYGGRYNFEYNGALNGSAEFAPKNRFAFFNSGALGWVVTEENFMSSLKENEILDMLKLRASYGEVGSDFIGFGKRWAYQTIWSSGGTTVTSRSGDNSIYEYYRQSQLGNEDVQWEVVRKFNFGIDYSFLGGMFAGSVDIFKDRRSDILLQGNSQAVPAYFGMQPKIINKGKAESKGYEFELRFNKQINDDLRTWANFSMTHAENVVKEKDDLPLAPNYQKAEGYAINQTTSFIDAGYINNIDELFGSPAYVSDDRFRMPGTYYIVDFNGDGMIDSKDSAPYAYTDTPQNTYNATIGVEWKGISFFAQFYGVNNVTRDVTLQSFGNRLNTVYYMGSVWTKDNTNADVTPYRWSTAPVSKEGGAFPVYGTQYKFDGSYVRLKNIELAYTWNQKDWIKNIGLSYLKLFVNGNNLWLWTRMPDDRESNLGGASYTGAYPTVKRFNVGLKLSL